MMKKSAYTLHASPAGVIFPCGHSTLTSGVHVTDNHGQIVMQFQPMYALISSIGLREATKGLDEASAIVRGEISEGYTGLNAHGCLIKKAGVEFYFDYFEDGVVPTGRVSLDQFKVALEAYVKFLNDPERKPVIVDFPTQ